MATKTLRSKKTRTKRRSLPRMARAPKPKKAATEQYSEPKAEPTFTLKQFAQAFGGNYCALHFESRPTEPLAVAMDAIEDLKNVVYVVNHHLGANDEAGMGDLMNAAWNRACAALNVLEPFRVAALPEVVL